MIKQALKRMLAAWGFEVSRRHARLEPKGGWAALLGDLPDSKQIPPKNVLEAYFDANQSGPGIWKWRHYFEIYDRHFAKFVGKNVHVLEIGIYSGGSLGMWKSYFGPSAKIYGVDIEPACKAYEDEQTKIFIGDQADSSFWDQVKLAVPHLDIVIDDGGHLPHQQIATMECLLPHLRPGGVFLCEDIVAKGNPFSAYVRQFADELNACDPVLNSDDQESPLCTNPTEIQRTVHSVHLYPLVAVIERQDRDVALVAPKHGTQWQPFHPYIRDPSTLPT
jgi:hypothetical protein